MNRPPHPAKVRQPTGAGVQALPMSPELFGRGPRRRGEPLPPALQRRVERFFETSFSDVRIHVGPEASSIGALALTVGSDLYFAPGLYEPWSERGQALIGHELAHVVQQRQGRVRNPLGSAGVAVVHDPALEEEAEELGARLSSGYRSHHDGPRWRRAPPPGQGIQRATAEAHGVVQPFWWVVGAVGLFTLEEIIRTWGRCVSENRNIISTGPKDLYATREKIEASNQALANGGAYIVLVRLDDTITDSIFGGFGSLNKVTVRPREARPPVGHQRELWQHNRDRLQQGQSYESWADCHRNAQTVMGSASGGANNDTERFVTAAADGARRVMDPPAAPALQGHGENAPDRSHANRGAYGFFAHAYPQFAGELGQNNADALKYADLIRRMQGVGNTFDAAFKAKVWRLYSDMHNDAELLDRFARRFKINRYVEVQVGDGITQVNNEIERANAPVGVDLWNFHWGGVIMVDGGSYVTFENLSLEDPEIKNERWYFRMYTSGTGDSFHDQNKRSEHVGECPLTLGYKSTGVQLPRPRLW